MSNSPAEMELFLQALEQEEPARQALLDAVEDAALRRRVLDLLAAHDELGDRDPLSVAHRPTGSTSRLIGRTVDGYRIVGELGRGGMGVVYDAEQLEPRRRVALKTLPLAQADPRNERRLEREAETLARLSHPGIAQVFGSGRADTLDGLPYLVMERIDGVPIDVFARQRDLDAHARLLLLARLCEALGHAHQRGVVHRDLKPSNVLVTADGDPKVLDFGIARLLDDDTLHTLRTRTGQVIGTLAYMPPEQLSGRNATASDTRADVYALGVLGYELLAGRLPVDLPDAPLASAIRQLAEAEPRPLGQVVPALRGDVDLVLGKALSRDPRLRYGDANALAADLRRLLADEPVQARAPSAVYQLRKFVRRHRAVCSLVAAVIASLGAGLAWALVERSSARDAQRTAERMAHREQARAESMGRVVNLLDRVVRSTAPQDNNGQDYTLTETVEMLAESIDRLYADDGYVLGKAHALLAQTMLRRDRLRDARHHLERARHELSLAELTTAYDRRFLASLDAQMRFQDGELDAALTEYEQALAMDSGDSELDASLERALQHGLAATLVTARRDLDRAERVVREILDAPGEGTDPHTHDLDLLARILEAQGRHHESLEVWDRYITALRDSEYYSSSLSLAKALQNQGLLLQEIGQSERAVEQLRESLAIRRRVLGDTPHTDTAFALDNLGCVLRDLGQHEEALELFGEAERLFRTIHGGPHLDLAVCLSEQALALRDLGRIDVASSILHEALDLFEALDGNPTPQHAAALEQLVLLDHEATPVEDRLAAADRAVAMRHAIHGADHHVAARAHEARAYIRFTVGRTEEAFADAARTRELREPIYGTDDWRTYASAWIEWIGKARSGDLQGALALNEAALAATRSSLGESSARVGFYERHRNELTEALAARDK